MIGVLKGAIAPEGDQPGIPLSFVVHDPGSHLDPFRSRLVRPKSLARRIDPDAVCTGWTALGHHGSEKRPDHDHITLLRRLSERMIDV